MASGDKYTIQEDTLTNIGDAIREMTDSQEGITPEDMPNAIRSINTGSDVTITPTLLSGTKIADYEIDGVGGSLYAPEGGGSSIDDTTISTASTWSSKKISSEVDAIYPTASATGAIASFESIMAKPFATAQFNVSGSDVTSMDIFVRGHNIWDGELEIRDNRLCSKNPIRVLPNTTYFFGTTRLYDIYLYDKDMTYLGKPSYTGLSDGYTFNTGANCVYIHFSLGGGNTPPSPFPFNYPSTDHTYYPYVGQNVTVTWETAIDNGYVDTVNGIVYDSDNDTVESITPLVISSVIGQNYVWCTTGNSTVSYRIPLSIPSIVDISQADFDLLPTAVKNNGTLYLITDGDVPNLDEMSF